jgi:hypothetical protein
MVPGAGIEPARPCEREILSLLCLPISPPGPFEIKLRPNFITKLFLNRLNY